MSPVTRSPGVGDGHTTIALPGRLARADAHPEIADYRFIKVIGRGAFGTVWLAEEPLAGTFRAIKVLDQARHGATGSRSALIERELAGLNAYQTRAANHPHLIQIFKTGLCRTYPSVVRNNPSPERERRDVDASKPEPTPVAGGPSDDEIPGMHQQAGASGAERLARPFPDGLPPAGSEAVAGFERGGSGLGQPLRDTVYYVMEVADHAGGARPHRPTDYQPLSLAALLQRKGRLPPAMAIHQAPLGRESFPGRPSLGSGSLGRESPLSRPTPLGVVEIGLALLDAIEHLHAAGIHHRDIKPSNIVFVGGVLKLADVGLAASENTESIGTSGYLTPEGKPDDLYALGKVMYEMVTGLPATAFPEWPADLGAGAPASSRWSVSRAFDRWGLASIFSRWWIADDEHPSPKRKRRVLPRSAAESRADARATGQLPGLCRLINRLCHPSPDRRLSDLRACRAELTAVSHPPHSPLMTRRRAGSLCAMVAFAAVMAGGAAMWAWYSRQDPTRQRLGIPPEDGSESLQSIMWNGACLKLSRFHVPGQVISISQAEPVTPVRFFDIQTAVSDGVMRVAGAFQIFNNGNYPRGSLQRPGGHIAQVYLLVGSRKVLLYHGQPGPAPGVRGRLSASVGLRDVDVTPLGHHVDVCFAFMLAPNPAQAEVELDLPENANSRIRIAEIWSVPLRECESESVPAASL